jgi:hypothetical protein
LRPGKWTDVADSPAADPLDAALQAGSGALIELQLVRATQKERPELRGDLDGAIEALRLALAQVRLARGTDQGPLAYGFVANSGKLDELPGRAHPPAGRPRRSI